MCRKSPILALWRQKIGVPGQLSVWGCFRDSTFSPFDTIPACDRQTNGQTHDVIICHTIIASRGKNQKASKYYEIMDIKPKPSARDSFVE